MVLPGRITDDWRGVFTVAGQYCGDCVVDVGVLRPKSAERTAGLVARIPQETAAGSVECVGEYDLVVYVPDAQSDGLYLATPDPAGSDYRGVIVHRPSESVYEVAGLPPLGPDPVFDVALATTGDSAPADIRTHRNVETDARGGITGSRYERLRDAGAPSEMTDPGLERIVLSPTARNSLRRDYFGQLLFNELAATTTGVRVSETASHESSLAVTGEQVAVSTPIQDVTVATTTNDEETVATARDAAMQAFEDGDPYKCPGGALAEFREAMTDQFDETLYEDFVTALRASGDLVDQQRAVVAAAANDCSLYAFSTLLEDRGLSSKATISRAKTTLEDVGAIETTQIEQDVGRPRQRLYLSDEDVGEANSDVAAVVDAIQ